jgi:uncharacterized protein YabE (DUF348 family)
VQKAFKNRWVKTGAQATVLAALILGLVSFVGANKTVALTVDGETQNVQTFGQTVADVLAAADVSVAPGDEVSPALDASVADGTAVTVNLSKSVDVSIDGVDRVVHTTGLTVADVLAQLKVGNGSEVSTAAQMELVSLDTPLEITTPKDVVITADGKTTKVSTTVATVKDLLAEAKVKVGTDDEVSRRLNTEVVDGLKVKVVRVDTRTETATEAIEHGTDTVKDSDLKKGTTKTLKSGKDGIRTLKFKVVTRDGKVDSRKLVDTKTTTKPVDAKIAIGTKKEAPKPAPRREAPRTQAAAKSPSSSAGSSSARSSAGGGTTASAAGVSSTWQALAKCESGGNWAINTGNGYYGGLQFSLGSWMGAGGGKYAAYPHQASPAEQIAVAENLRANGGWGHWPACSSKLGLR